MNFFRMQGKKARSIPAWKMLFRYGRKEKIDRTTQLIFCDLSTPKGDGTFNVYDDVRNKLVDRGIPKEEIAFIHEYNTEVKKAELFAKVRAGQVRILMGSTPKLGAGTNVQDRLTCTASSGLPLETV